MVSSQNNGSQHYALISFVILVLSSVILFFYMYFKFILKEMIISRLFQMLGKD